jgi:hypothetical protein
MVEDDVEPDGRRLGPADRTDQLRHARARPRPAPERGQALLVDGDDRHLRRRLERAAQQVAQIGHLQVEEVERPGGQQAHGRDRHADGRGESSDRETWHRLRASGANRFAFSAPAVEAGRRGPS